MTPAASAGRGARPTSRSSTSSSATASVAAVDGVDLDIARGEFFTMLGPSGSGKTTTLRLIAGFEQPDGGRVELGGEDVTRPPALRARRQHGLPGLRAVPAHDRRRERRVRAADPQGRRGPSARGAPARRSSMVRLDGPRRRASPAQLSGGQRQRVALARAIVNRPRVLLLDEPLGALDLKLRQEMQVELKRIQREVGITFVYVTHDQEEALTMSDRLAVFNAGRIEQVGAPAEVYEHPANEFVAGFVGVSNVARARRAALHDPPGEGPAARRRRGRRRPARRGRARSRDVAYAGMVTRYAVALDARRRASGGPAEPRDLLGAGARELRGRRVRVGVARASRRRGHRRWQNP